jgi:hypothetical protein
MVVAQKITSTVLLHCGLLHIAWCNMLNYISSQDKLLLIS